MVIIKEKKKGLNRHWKNYLDKNYLGSHNLEQGEEMLLTIAKFEGEEAVQGADGSKSVKQVLYFKENVPKMILNITNGTTISALYGSHPEGWIGKKVQLFATPVKAFGKVQDALRVRDVVPSVKINNEQALLKVGSCKSVDELKKVYTSLSVEERNDVAVLKLKDTMKANLK